jgi:hypothetical protein
MVHSVKRIVSNFNLNFLSLTSFTDNYHRSHATIADAKHASLWNLASENYTHIIRSANERIQVLYIDFAFQPNPNPNTIYVPSAIFVSEAGSL